MRARAGEKIAVGRRGDGMWMRGEMRWNWDNVGGKGKWFQVDKVMHDVTPRRRVVAWRWRRTESTRRARADDTSAHRQGD